MPKPVETLSLRTAAKQLAKLKKRKRSSIADAELFNLLRTARFQPGLDSVTTGLGFHRPFGDS